MIKWFTILLALLGLTMGVWTVATSKEEVPKPPPAQPPSVNPFAHGVAASGIVEARSRNVQVQAPEPSLVMRVFVDAGQEVKAGDPLFELDARLIDAEIHRARAAVTLAEAERDRLKRMPRAEQIPPLEATVEVAAVLLEDAKDQLERTEAIVSKEAGTQNELLRKRFLAAQLAKALVRAKAELTLAKAGAWEEDIAVAQSRVEQAQAELKALDIRRERLTVRAPIDGRVLKRHIEPGEFTDTNPANPALVLGDMTRLRVRAQVDEEDAPLVHDGDNAVARIRGALDITLPLRMIRIEPLAQSKTQITGQNSERVDTRVVDVLFEIDSSDVTGVYPGQIVDVFIDVKK